MRVKVQPEWFHFVFIKLRDTNLFYNITDKRDYSTTFFFARSNLFCAVGSKVFLVYRQVFLAWEMFQLKRGRVFHIPSKLATAWFVQVWHPSSYLRRIALSWDRCFLVELQCTVETHCHCHLEHPGQDWGYWRPPLYIKITGLKVAVEFEVNPRRLFRYRFPTM